MTSKLWAEKDGVDRVHSDDKSGVSLSSLPSGRGYQTQIRPSHMDASPPLGDLVHTEMLEHFLKGAGRHATLLLDTFSIKKKWKNRSCWFLNVNQGTLTEINVFSTLIYVWFVFFLSNREHYNVPLQKNSIDFTHNFHPFDCSYRVASATDLTVSPRVLDVWLFI